MWAFNAEVTAYPGIALPLYSHDCLIALVLSLGTLWETAFGGMPLSPVLGNVPWQFGPSLFVLGHIFFLGVGLGPDMKWAEVAKFFGPIETFEFLLTFLFNVAI